MYRISSSPFLTKLTPILSHQHLKITPTSIKTKHITAHLPAFIEPPVSFAMHGTDFAALLRCTGRFDLVDGEVVYGYCLVGDGVAVRKRIAVGVGGGAEDGSERGCSGCGGCKECKGCKGCKECDTVCKECDTCNTYTCNPTTCNTHTNTHTTPHHTTPHHTTTVLPHKAIKLISILSPPITFTATHLLTFKSSEAQVTYKNNTPLRTTKVLRDVGALKMVDSFVSEWVLRVGENCVVVESGSLSATLYE